MWITCYTSSSTFINVTPARHSYIPAGIHRPSVVSGRRINSLEHSAVPSEIQLSPSLTLFRQRLKTYLFQKSFPDVLLWWLRLRGPRNNICYSGHVKYFSDWLIDWSSMLCLLTYIHRSKPINRNIYMLWQSNTKKTSKFYSDVFVAVWAVLEHCVLTTSLMWLICDMTWQRQWQSRQSRQSRSSLLSSHSLYPLQTFQLDTVSAVTLELSLLLLLRLRLYHCVQLNAVLLSLA